MTNQNMISVSLVLVVAFGSAWAQVPSPSEEGVGRAEEATEQASARMVDSLADADLEPWRRVVLEQAFQVATAIPVTPYVKDRSRVQAEVLDAFLELGLLESASIRCSKIENWRRAETIGKIAAAMSRRDDVSPDFVRSLVARSDRNHPEDLVPWRRHRIDIQVAMALANIDDMDAALAIESRVDPTQQGRLVGEKIDELTVAQARTLMTRIDAAIETRNLDLVLSAIRILNDLHRQFHDETELRVEIERRVDASADLAKIPHDLRIAAILALAQNAIDEGDDANARKLVSRAREIYDAVQSATPFPPEFGAGVLGGIAAKRAAAKDVEKARNEIVEVLEIYEEGIQTIPDVFRAKALRPIAEAAHHTGDPELTNRIVLKVIEAGSTNPNARPRAEDLARTLVVLARIGAKPSDELQSRIDAIITGLADPW